MSLGPDNPSEVDVQSIIETYSPADLRNLNRTDQARLQAALKEGWRLTPATLGVKITMGRWIAARHLLHISTIISTEIAKGGARIIMCMPARHGKSEFLSVNTPIWFLEKWPNKYVMTISYGSELATDFSLKVRDTFQNEDLHHLLRSRVRKDKQKVDRFLMTGGGGLTAAGVGGPLTGRGADLMLIDDYIKNAEQSLSETQRNAIWEWFKSTAYTRLEPGASLIILATRWNARDLIGMCLEEMPNENWKVINLPALAVENDPLGREVGEPLWPERYSLESLLRIKEALGTYWWEAMYQQNPLPSMGGADLGNKINVISKMELPQHRNIKSVRAWDVAATHGGGDFSVGAKLTLDRDSGRVVIEDIQRFQKSPGGTQAMVDVCADMDGHGVPIWMEQEPGSSGKTVIEHYVKFLQGYQFRGERATGPIEVRAQPFMAAVEAGRIDMVKADWNEPLKHELNAFPDGEHDDQIIAIALAYNKLIKGMYGGLTWGRGDDKVVPIEKARAARNRASDDAIERAKSKGILTW